MNAELQLPILTVFGSNWTCDVQIDETNAQFPFEDQCYEAATQAIEAVKGVRENLTLQITDQDKTLDIGHMLRVHVKGENPNKKAVFVESYIALANAGLHKDSAISQGAFIKKRAELQADREKRSLEHQRQLMEFDDLKKNKKPDEPK